MTTISFEIDFSEEFLMTLKNIKNSSENFIKKD